MRDKAFVSIIIPCYNEEKYISALLRNLEVQDYSQDLLEIIFADGRSEDRTREIIEAYAKVHPHVFLVDNPHRYVPQALNAAIRASKGSVIVRLDAHAVYPSNYISTLVERLELHGADNVGAVWDSQPGNDSDEALAIVLATSHPVGIGNASYRLGAGEDMRVDTVPYGCFRRELFDRIGYFDEDLVRNQDDEFNGRILRNGGSIWLIPELKIRYFARESRKKLAKMFYQYGLFKPLVNQKLGSAATMRQFAPPLLVLGLTMPLLAAAIIPAFIWLWLAAVSFYFFLICLAAVQACGKERMRLFPHVLLTFPYIHFSYGFGYIFGIWKFMIRKDHLRKKRNTISSSR